jgi:hypothetical protein
MTTAGLCLGAIIALALALIAWFAWRRWRRAPDHFTYATPATPRVREAVGALFASLRHVAALGRAAEAQIAGHPDLEGARHGVSHVARTLDCAGDRISCAPPTYANYLGLYRGLAGSDAALLCAANAYVAAGHETHREAAASPTTGTGTFCAARASDADVGNALIAFGHALPLVVADVHRLGAALDVE